MFVKKLVEPNPELAYRYTNWSIVMKSGKMFSGMILEETKDRIWLGIGKGGAHTVKVTDIDTRAPLKTSVMPTNAVSGLTVEEFRDLLAFLERL